MTTNTKKVNRVLIVATVERDQEHYSVISDLFKGTLLEISNRLDFAKGSMKLGVVSQHLMDFGEIVATGECDLIHDNQVGLCTIPEDWDDVLVKMELCGLSIGENVLQAMVALATGKALITPTTVVSDSEITGSYKEPTAEALEMISADITDNEEAPA